MKIDVNIVNRNGTVFAGKANMVVIPGSEGELGVMYGHVPMIVRLQEGVIYTYLLGEVTSSTQIEKGIAKITGTGVSIISA
ncbi:MAG: hypothetical protein KA998_03280 [Rickettsiaceae bacterium]|nr:hypothetical protein [Rickettsiaceae bacterium]